MNGVRVETLDAYLEPRGFNPWLFPVTLSGSKKAGPFDPERVTGNSQGLKPLGARRLVSDATFSES